MNREHTHFRRTMTRRAFLLLAAVLSTLSLGLSYGDLDADPQLTPARFAWYFRGFKYEFLDDIQPPDVFLGRESGDCDDYGTLASDLLTSKGMKPFLVSVRMPGLNHVVCYVEESKGYLDYNNRTFFKRVEACDSSLPKIAGRVAHSFGANWTSVSEFTWDGRVKRLVRTVSKVGDKKVEVATQPATRPKRDIVIDF